MLSRSRRFARPAAIIFAVTLTGARSADNSPVLTDVIGTTTADVVDYGYCDGEQDRPMPNSLVSIEGGASGYSDLEGAFTLPHEGSQPVGVSTRLQGRWVDVTNLLGPDPVLTGVAVPGEPIELHWSDASASDGGRSAYFHTNRIHDIVKYYDPSWTAPDYVMPVMVNAEFTCGAHWNGTGIQLGRAGFGCANIAELGDVIYHEYAHAITQWIYGGSPEDVGPGNADVAVVFVTGDPIIGEGFFEGDCQQGLRDVRNTLQYPDDYIPGDPFHNGQIIAGFWWDAREALIASYGEEEGGEIAWRVWHMSRRNYQPMSMPDQVFYAFVEDDDDGDLSNGTPHYDELCLAAQNHGFECPAITSATPDGGVPQGDRRRISCAPNPMVSSTTIAYRVTGEAASTAIRIFDLTGRPVRTLKQTHKNPGQHTIDWDGADGNGRRLPAGIYYLELQHGARRASGRVILLK
ncbi:MAG: T9SS type A sorting domain-containing protein [Candidatus Eisenbacteria bacterium]|nr:T9SS type A sorting domain-containing protein [Candidatus Eisenbacteria bacterium]